MDATMSNLEDFIGGGIQPPAIARDLIFRRWNAQYRFPIEGSGDYMQLPSTTTTNYESRTQADAVSWTVDHADVDASAAAFSAFFWYDETDQKMWVVANRGTTALHTLATVAISNGAVAVIGTFTPTIASSVTGHANHTERAAMGSGDFTWYSGAGIRTISSSNGAMSGEAATISAGYRTKDGNLGCHLNIIDTDLGIESSSELIIKAFSGSDYTDALIGVTREMAFGFGTGSATAVLTSFMPWGDDYVAMGIIFTSSTANPTARVWHRDDFDRWLKETVRAAGIEVD